VATYIYSTVCSELTAERLVIPLSLGDCGTATNKAAYASKNNDHISHRPINKVACIAYSGVCWSHHEIRKLQHGLRWIMRVQRA